MKRGRAPGSAALWGFGGGFDGFVAGRAWACCAEGADLEGVERSGDEAFDGGAAAGAGFGVFEGCGGVVDFALDFVGGCAGDGVPDEVDGAWEVAGGGVEVLRCGG